MSLDYTQLNWLHYREVCGLERSFVAAEIGVTRQSIYVFETGRQKPSKENAKKLADLYHKHLLNRRDDLMKKQTQVGLLLFGIEIQAKEAAK